MTITVTSNKATNSDIRAYIANDGKNDVDLMWHLEKNKDTALVKFMSRLVAKYGVGFEFKMGY